MAMTEEEKAEMQSLKDKNDELSKNLVNQRKDLESQRDAAITERDEAKGLIEANETKVREELTNYQNTRIEAIAKGDKTVADKIRAEMGNLKFDETSREGIDQGALKAYQLATAVEPNGFAIKADNQMTDVQPEDSTKLSPEAAAVGAKMFPDSAIFNPPANT